MTGDQRRYIGVGAGALAVIGAFLPWIKIDTVFGSLTANGVDDGRDGTITAIAGAVGALVLWLKPSWRWLACLCGLVVAAVAIYDIVDVDNKAKELEAEAEGFANVSVGSGLYVTLVAGIALAIVAATVKVRKPSPAVGLAPYAPTVPPPPPPVATTPPQTLPPPPPPGFATGERPSEMG